MHQQRLGYQPTLWWGYIETRKISNHVFWRIWKFDVPGTSKSNNFHGNHAFLKYCISGYLIFRQTHRQPAYGTWQFYGHAITLSWRFMGYSICICMCINININIYIYIDMTLPKSWDGVAGYPIFWPSAPRGNTTSPGNRSLRLFVEDLFLPEECQQEDSWWDDLRTAVSSTKNRDMFILMVVSNRYKVVPPRKI